MVVLGLILGAVWFIDHRGYQRAERDAEAERAEIAALIEEAVSGIEDRVVDKINERAVEVVETERRIETIDRTTIQPVIERELRDAPHLSDPARGYGLGLRDAVNAAIEQSTSPAAP